MDGTSRPPRAKRGQSAGPRSGSGGEADVAQPDHRDQTVAVPWAPRRPRSASTIPVAVGVGEVPGERVGQRGLLPEQVVPLLKHRVVVEGSDGLLEVVVGAAQVRGQLVSPRKGEVSGLVVREQHAGVPGTQRARKPHLAVSPSRTHRCGAPPTVSAQRSAHRAVCHR